MITQERRDQNEPVLHEVSVSAPSLHGPEYADTHTGRAVDSLAGDHAIIDDQTRSVASIVTRLIADGHVRRQLVSFTTRATLQLKAIEKLGKLRPNSLIVETAGRPIAYATQSVRPARLRIERRMVTDAKQLPVWPWVKGVRGCGPLGLGIIVCETGNLSNYSNPGKLWKRLGLAVFDDRAQRKVSDKAEARRQGYSPKRRAVMHNVGESLLRQNGKTGYYRLLYDERKDRESELHPNLPLKQRHRRALRYMEKRFLLHLWQAWKKAASR